MCVINIILNTTTPAGTTLTNSQGRYRKVGTTTWTNFVVNLSDPKTPNITGLGQYQLEVNITNSLGVVSDWAVSSFEVTNTCSETTGGITDTTDNTIYYYAFARECFDGALLQNGVIGNTVLRSTTNINNWIYILVPKYTGDIEAVLQIYAQATEQDYNNNVGYFASIDLDIKEGVTEQPQCYIPPVSTPTCNLNLVKVANNFRLENCTIGKTYKLLRSGVIVKTLQSGGTSIIFQAPPGGFGSGVFVALEATFECSSNTINNL